MAAAGAAGGAVGAVDLCRSNGVLRKNEYDILIGGRPSRWRCGWGCVVDDLDDIRRACGGPRARCFRLCSLCDPACAPHLNMQSPRPLGLDFVPPSSSIPARATDAGELSIDRVRELLAHDEVPRPQVRRHQPLSIIELHSLMSEMFHNIIHMLIPSDKLDASEDDTHRHREVGDAVEAINEGLWRALHLHNAHNQYIGGLHAENALRLGGCP